MARVLVPIADGCEEIEAVTIIDLLRRAGIEVVVAGLDATPVRASRGVVLVPDTDLDHALTADYDMVVLPGGAAGADRLKGDDRILSLLRRLAESGKFTAAICAAPKVLAEAGLLEGRRATSFPGHLDPANVRGLEYAEESVVQDGKVVTSRGPGSAMDFALHLIEQLLGYSARRRVEDKLMRPQ